MLLKIKKALSSAAQGLGNFQTLDISELEKFAQDYNFNQPLIRLEPIMGGLGSIDIGGVVHSKLTIRIWFLTRFDKDDTITDTKDALIDKMEELSFDYYRLLNQSQSLSQGSLSDWTIKVERQVTSNLLCGVLCEAKLDTTCNRL
jgi:hypothetical protein